MVTKPALQNALKDVLETAKITNAGTPIERNFQAGNKQQGNNLKKKSQYVSVYSHQGKWSQLISLKKHTGRMDQEARFNNMLHSRNTFS